MLERWRVEVEPGYGRKELPAEVGNVGGKFGTPWPRMHLARASAALRCASVKGTPADLLLGYSLMHVAIANRNAGNCFIPGTIGPPGSGKLATPCERNSRHRDGPRSTQTERLTLPAAQARTPESLYLKVLFI